MLDAYEEPLPDDCAECTCIQLILCVMSAGPYLGATLKVRIKNRSHIEQDVIAGAKRLEEIAHAVGIAKLRRIEELYNKPFVAHVYLDQATNPPYRFRNRMMDVRSIVARH